MTDGIIRYTRIPSPVGALLVYGDDRRLAGLAFDGHRSGPSPATGWVEDPAAFDHVASQLASYFAGDLQRFSLELDLSGTPFQQQVWHALTGIGYGEVTTYGSLARTIGRPTAVRAVAAAIARNPVGIIVPCHRVVGADGGLTGFAGGIERKRALLDLEHRTAGAVMAHAG